MAMSTLRTTLPILAQFETSNGKIDNSGFLGSGAGIYTMGAILSDHYNDNEKVE
jgi:hypothetical protein